MFFTGLVFLACKYLNEMQIRHGMIVVTGLWGGRQ